MPSADTIIVGAGQAGLALSRHLTRAGADHVVFERGRVGERWHSERWPSLHLLTPNWLNRLPGAPVPDDPDGFQAAIAFAAGLDGYARSFGAPVREHTPVARVAAAGRGYVAHAGGRAWLARSVVVATGDCQLPAVPPIAAAAPRAIAQLHAVDYRDPAMLAPGAVLVVGAGASGQQIADELVRAGRRVVLAVGSHARMLRRYRGCDTFTWLHRLGKLDEPVEAVADPAAARARHSPALTGARGGEELDLGVLAERGVEIAGRLTGFAAGHARFADDLPTTVARAEGGLRRLLVAVDAHLGSPGDHPAAVDLGPGPRELALDGFGTILWATGYRRAYPWLQVPVLDGAGEIVHDRGATPSPGLYVLGLRFQRRRSSHLIGGVGDDARALADHLIARATTMKACTSVLSTSSSPTSTGRSPSTRTRSGSRSRR
jgi:putative flavoprotein involved in K+ transport